MACEQGVTADTAGESEDGFTFNDVISMLALDIIIYSVLAWYTGNVRETKDTTRKETFYLTFECIQE